MYLAKCSCRNKISTWHSQHLSNISSKQYFLIGIQHCVQLSYLFTDFGFKPWVRCLVFDSQAGHQQIQVGIFDFEGLNKGVQVG